MTLLCWCFGAGGQWACPQRGEESIKDVLSSLDIHPGGGCSGTEASPGETKPER